MRVCIVIEGSYPYVTGGVSSWIHQFIKSFPNVEFVLQTIIRSREQSGQFIYEIPENVIEIHELYLQDEDWSTNKKGRIKKRLNKHEFAALRSLILNHKVNWEELFKLFQNPHLSLNKLLMGEDFLNIVRNYYDLYYNQLIFSDFLWTMRSIYLPLFFTLKVKLPKADLYHCMSTGYAGVLGVMGKSQYGGRFLLSEHGIYTREREEEIIPASWVKGAFKNIWIEQFHKMSALSYKEADLVTSLYKSAQKLQIDLGCDPQKTRITPNGIPTARLQNLPGKQEEDSGKFNIGAILRITPIKDVKTLIQAFSFAKEKEPRLKLWLMGPMDEDENYAQECQEQVQSLGLEEDVIFTGTIDIREYLGRMDVTILTSISEGQPLTILESYAAHIPVIATDVGNCSGLIYGENDNFGPAGILTHIMNIEEIAQAMVEMAQNESMRKQMGENGYNRVMAKYQIEQMRDRYRQIYQDFANDMNLNLTI